MESGCWLAAAVDDRNTTYSNTLVCCNAILHFEALNVNKSVPCMFLKHT